MKIQKSVTHTQEKRNEETSPKKTQRLELVE